MKALVAIACLCIVAATGYAAWKEFRPEIETAIGQQEPPPFECKDAREVADAAIADKSLSPEEMIKIRDQIAEVCGLKSQP
jgi:hypothetical protein